MTDLSPRGNSHPSLWMWLDSTNKILTFLVYVGSIFSAASTTLIIYIYCKNNRILFLMPLVFEKISFDTFLLFFIPVLLTIVFPIYFGVWGGTSSLEIKKNPDTNYLIGTNYLRGEVTSSSNTFIFWCVVIVGGILVFFSPFLFFSTPIEQILFYDFTIPFFLNYLILRKFLYEKKNIKKSNFSIWFPALFPSIGGSVFGIPYYLVSKDLFGLPLPSGWVFFLLIFPTLLSSSVFFIILFVERWVSLLLLAISTFFFFLFPQLLLHSSMSNSYFLKMKYGFIPIRIVIPSDSYEKSPQKFFIGKILFNSGSDLYVTLNQTQNGSSSLIKFYMKQGKLPKKIRPNQVIQISYKDLETIPLEPTSP